MKPSVPKGTRDFLPQEVYKREYIFTTIKSVFQTYGYVPIETPTMENLETLTGKYGEEGDKLLFKVLNNGDYLAKADKAALEELNSKKLTPSISKRGMRYDLTVPFARYVVQHRNDIQFPFKRYQIQPVWRADRPQKGRYQEFYQCDVDVVGSDSLMYEAELVQIYDQAFSKLNLPVKILVNNRKILFGFAEATGITDKFVDMTTALDKLDKSDEEKVTSDMVNRGIPESAAKSVLEMSRATTLAELEQKFENAPTGLKGIEELRMFHNYLDKTASHNEITFTPSLARGLNYYTGCIFEVKAKGVKIGSIGGGGRYDNLTEVFGLKGTSGVGVSFGFARIYLALDELGLFPDEASEKTKVLFVALDQKSHEYAFEQCHKLRSKGIASDIYPSPSKMKKQMGYADKRNIPFVAIIGEQERTNQMLVIKNMSTGEQTEMPPDQLAAYLSNG